jgi:hypothetical protein
VRRFGVFEGLKLVASIACLVVGAWTISQARDFSRQEEKLEARGFTAHSQVAARWFTRQYGTTTFWIRYSFFTLDKKAHLREERVSRQFYYDHRLHTPLRIRYLDDDLDHARAEIADSGWFVFGLSGMLFAAGVFGVGQGGWRLARGAVFERRGTAARATVDHVAELSIFIEEKQLCELVYRYVDAAGREHSGRSLPLPRALALAYERRGNVAIVYDSRRPQDSRLDEPLTELSDPTRA